MIWYILIAFVLGVLTTLLFITRNNVGTMAVYISDEDEPPYPYGEFTKSMADVCKKKYVLMKVDVRHIGSRN